MKHLPPQEFSAVHAVSMAGFLPGERVAVAIIADDLIADPQGSLDSEALAELLDHQAADLVVLLGRTSGNLVIGPEE